MLDHKGGVKDNTSASVKMEGDITNIMTYENLIKEDIKDPASGWRKIVEGAKDKDGFSYTLHARPSNKDSNINMVRMDLIMPGLTKDAWFTTFKDGPPVDNAVERRVVREISPTQRILYVRMRLGTFISDRDNCIMFSRIEHPDGSSVLSLAACEDPDVPEVPNVIRAEFFKTQRIIEHPDNKDDLMITDFSLMNLKGYFPVRIFNMMIGTIMPKGLK